MIEEPRATRWHPGDVSRDEGLGGPAASLVCCAAWRGRESGTMVVSVNVAAETVKVAFWATSWRSAWDERVA